MNIHQFAHLAHRPRSSWRESGTSGPADRFPTSGVAADPTDLWAFATRPGLPGFDRAFDPSICRSEALTVRQCRIGVVMGYVIEAEVMWLSAIARYPVKSLRGQALSMTPVDARGITGDRRWMVVDERHRFVTRREVPAMALIEAGPTTGGLILSHPTGTCHATFPGDDAPVVDATIWRDTLPVRLGNDIADAFLSRVLDRPVRLAYQFDASRRAIDRRYAVEGDHVSLADGFPLLVTTTASLDALNARLNTTITMDRFRPNLVIAGAEPWAEDRWRRLRIGTVELRLARPCSRCIVVTQQPDTGKRLDGNEPLATLRAMGRFVAGGGVMFGQNAIPGLLGTLHVGEEVEVLEEGESNVRASA